MKILNVLIVSTPLFDFKLRSSPSYARRHLWIFVFWKKFPKIQFSNIFIFQCVWPIESGMEFIGKSDFLKFYKYIRLKGERKTEKKNKRRTEQNRSTNVVEVDVEDTFESFQFEKLSAFSVPIMMSPIARTPRREREVVPIPEDNQIVVSQNEEEQVIYSGDLNNGLVRL